MWAEQGGVIEVRRPRQGASWFEVESAMLVEMPVRLFREVLGS